MKLIPVTCPHCGAFTEVAEEYAGQTGPCASCKKPVTVPQPANIQDVRPKRLSQIGRWLGMVVGGLLLLGIGVTVFTLVFIAAFQPQSIPLLGRTGPPPPECLDNLERIGKAIQAYVEDKGHYPPAYTVDEKGKPQHSWRALILPYLGEHRLYAKYDMSKPWDSPENQWVGNRMPDAFACPMHSGAANDTSYMVVRGPTLIFHKDNGREPKEITDGLASTLMVAEVHNMDTHWLEPNDLDVSSLEWLINGPKGMGSRHYAEGAHLLMADGKVLHLGSDVPPEDLQAIATISGEETVNPQAWVRQDEP